MAAEENKAIVRKWVEQVWNAGNYSHAREVLSPSYKFNDPTAVGMPPGPEPFIEFVTTFRAAMPDLKITIKDMVAEGNQVVWRWHATGTHDGPLMGIPPTGKHADITGIVITRFENGKWAEDYSNWDMLGLLQQVGAIPELAAA